MANALAASGGTWLGGGTMPRRPNMLRAYARRNRNGHSQLAWNQSWRRTLGCLLCVAGLLCCAGSSLAANPNQATSSRPAREDAIRSVPLDKLDESIRAQVSATISNASIYRRMPIQVIDCDPDLYLFLVRHPEVIVGIWDVMKISNVSLE